MNRKPKQIAEGEMKVGERIKFKEEKQKYTIQALSDNFAVCTKPFNLKHTIMYTIIDFRKQIRGTENLIFCMGFETRLECEEALTRLESGETEVSYRNRVSLNIINP